MSRQPVIGKYMYGSEQHVDNHKMSIRVLPNLQHPEWEAPGHTRSFHPGWHRGWVPKPLAHFRVVSWLNWSFYFRALVLTIQMPRNRVLPTNHGLALLVIKHACWKFLSDKRTVLGLRRTRLRNNTWNCRHRLCVADISDYMKLIHLS